MLLLVLRGRNTVCKEMQIFLLVLIGIPCSWSGSSVFKSVPLTSRGELRELIIRNLLREEISSQWAVVGWERFACYLQPFCCVPLFLAVDERPKKTHKTPAGNNQLCCSRAKTLRQVFCNGKQPLSNFIIHLPGPVQEASLHQLIN